MDHYATEMSQSSIPGPSQDEPQAQLQHAELVPFDMYADPSQYAPPGPAPTAYGMETAAADVPSFATHFPQSQMAPGALFDPPIPPPFEPYFAQPQMAPGPLYDPPIPLPYNIYFPQPQMMPEPSHQTSAPLPFGVYLPQPSYGHPSPPSTIQSLNDLLLELAEAYRIEDSQWARRKSLGLFDASHQVLFQRTW